jgi:hypothetical protein
MSQPPTLTEFRIANAQLLLADMASTDYGTVTDVQMAHLLGRARVVIGNLVETIEEAAR